MGSSRGVYGTIQRLLRGTVAYWPQPVRTLWHHVTENTPTFVLIYSGLPAHQIQAHQSVKTELSYFVTYHDHAIEITAANAYFGQAGFYISRIQLSRISSSQLAITTYRSCLPPNNSCPVVNYYLQKMNEIACLEM
jgi:hypothetical protein